MPELLRRWIATVGKLALSVGLLWMGVDLAHAQPTPASVAAAPAWVASIDTMAADGGCSHGF